MSLFELKMSNTSPFQGNFSKYLNERSENVKKRKSTENLNIIDKSSEITKKEFWIQLTLAFMAANIPINKLDNPVIKKFLEIFTGFEIPHSSTIYKNYVKNVYDKALDKIRDEIGDNKVYLQIDETTNRGDRILLNVLCGKLDGRKSKPMLISTQILENTKSETIIKGICNACRNFWPNSNGLENVLVILTDAAPNMKCAIDMAKKDYKDLKHVTCLAHGMHNVCQFVRVNFDLTNEFISNMKHLMKNSPKRKNELKNFCSIPLPKNPVVTRWCSWINASIYYNTNIDKITKFIEQMETNNNKNYYKLERNNL